MKSLVLTAILLLAAASPSAQAQDTAAWQAVAPASAYPGAAARSYAYLDSLVRAERLPGVTAAVAVDGRIVWSEGFGWADLEQRVSAWPHTKMRVGSVAKAFTAVALGQLYEAGRLDFDAPVQDYAPAFPAKRWPVTVRQVGGHIAGIRHYRGAEFLSDDRYATVDDALAIFAGDTLLFEPGSRYVYSSYGFNLLSAVVEGASGEDFLGYMRRHVFTPLGMRDTVADHADSLITHRTRFYSRGEDGRLRNAPYVDLSNKWAGGGFLSTAEDLARFGNAVLGGFLEPATLAVLTTPQRKRDGEATNYGIGFTARTDEAGRRVVGHSGGSVGGTTMFVVYPEEGVAVAVISNLGGAGGIGGAAYQIADLFIHAR